jgi:hypothetical protein
LSSSEKIAVYLFLALPNIRRPSCVRGPGNSDHRIFRFHPLRAHPGKEGRGQGRAHGNRRSGKVETEAEVGSVVAVVLPKHDVVATMMREWPLPQRLP